MSLVTVQNTVTDPAGQPVYQAVVTIKLVISSTGVIQPGYTTTSTIAAVYQTTTSTTGAWSVALTPNSTITPSNTYYEVWENGQLSTIVVPASGGPYTVEQLLVTPPAPSPVGITGVQVAANGSIAGSRPEINLVAGLATSITAVDNSADNRIDATIAVVTGTTSSTVVVGNDARVNNSGTVTGVTYNSLNQVTAYTENGVAWTGITYNGAGQVTGYTVAGTARTVSYNSLGQVTGVS